MATTIIKDADFHKQIKSAPAAGYLLFGEEDYLKDFAVRRAREALGGDAAFACFNELVIDALDYHPERLRSALMPPPMMAERKVILLRGMDFTAMRQSELDALCEVLAELKEYDYNTLLLPVASGAIDEGYLPRRPSAQLSRLGEVLTLVQFERCTPAKLNGWCIRHFSHNGVAASAELCDALIARCGRNMLTLAGEIDKLCFYVLAHGRSAVTSEDIATVATACAEYDAFALTNALMARDTARALDVLAELKFRRVEPLLVLSEVIRAACDLLAVLLLTREGKTPAEISRQLKMHEFKTSLYCKQSASIGESGLRRMIAACTATDRALKSSSGQGYGALEQLICSL